ncbi:MAG: hypothetical protein R6V19_05265 [Armatimonadota bacterium]
MATTERNDVLLVPDAAIDRSGGKTTVQVLPGPGAQPEERDVKVGITDYMQTVVLDGLKEGEIVMLPEGAPTLQRDENDPARNARRSMHMIRRRR